MTCSSPTHDALIFIGGVTYCAQCFHAGSQFGMKHKEDLQRQDQEIQELAKTLALDDLEGVR